MADIHQWRRMVQPRRSRSQDLREAQEQYSENVDVNSMSKSRRFSSDYIEAQSARARPKSRLASYLSNHRSSSVLEKPDNSTFDSPAPNDKDDVYDPDPLQMSYTIQKRLLAFPAQGLPAQYNSLLMHLIEAFRHLCIDRLELLEKLDEEKKNHEAELHDFQREKLYWLKEREAHKLQIANTESLLARSRKESSTPTGAPAANAQALRRVDSLRKPDATSKDRASGQEEMRKKTRKRSSRYQWPSSPSRSMARLSKRFLTSCDDTELLPIALSPSANYQASLGRHNANAATDTGTLFERATSIPTGLSDSEPSSVEGDLLPDEEALLTTPTAQAMKNEVGSAIRLSKWLAERVGSDPEEVFPVIAELLAGKPMAVPKYASGLGSDIAVKPLPQLPGSRNASPAPDVTTSIVQRSASDENLPLRSKSVYRQGHRREFSFLPGDDTKSSVVSLTDSLNGSTKSPPPFVEGSAGNRLATQSTRGIEPLSSFGGPTLSPRREDSGRSATTAIRDSTSRSSSGSNRDSRNSERAPKASGVLSPRSRNNPAAVAAAQAASNCGLTSGTERRTTHLTTNLTTHEYYRPLGEGLQGTAPPSLK